MRTAFSESLVRLAKADSSVLLMTGDHGYSLFDDFRRECSGQYINAGIAEQNMVGMAAGLARSGFIPFVYGLSAFIPVRVIEQIKIDIAHDNLPVIFIGDGAGLVYSHLGTSHQSTEDIACTRAIPNLSVYSPADRFELTACMDLAYASKSPIYIRIGKSDLGDVHLQLPKLTIGSLECVKLGINRNITFIATGSFLKTAVKLAETEYPDATIWSAPFIKPLNVNQISDVCSKSQLVVVLEEHSVIGGLGSAISEIASEFAPVRVLRIGVKDRFSEYCGTYEYLLKEHDLNIESIKQSIDAFVNSI